MGICLDVHSIVHRPPYPPFAPHSLSEARWYAERWQVVVLIALSGYPMIRSQPLSVHCKRAGGLCWPRNRMRLRRRAMETIKALFKQ